MSDIMIPEITPKLLDLELTEANKRRALLRKISLEIENILLRESVTMGELGEIMDLFNARAHSVFSKAKVEEVKKSFEKLI